MPSDVARPLASLSALVVTRAESSVKRAVTVFVVNAAVPFGTAAKISRAVD